MIEVNPGDLNLQTLAGNATVLVDGSDMPNTLYVFGVGDTEYDYYVDPIIPNCELLVNFLQEKNFRVALDMPHRPKLRPAVGISRETREFHIDEATNLCILVLLFLNGRLEVPTTFIQE